VSTIENLKLIDPPIFARAIELSTEKVTGLVGPSGGGKTTLIKILCGLIKPDSGSWIMNGVDLLNLKPQERRLGVVFQDQTLFPHLTAKENIKLGATLRNIKDAEKKIFNLVERLKILDCMNKKAAVLSGGEKQRVALARALIGEPHVLILDEPFSALDETSKANAIDLTKQMILKFKIPTLLVSHDKEEVSAFTDFCYELSGGVVKRK